MVFLDQPREMLILSCVLRLGGRREADFEAFRGDCGTVLQQRAAVSLCIWSVAPRDRFLARKSQREIQSKKSIPKHFSCHSFDLQEEANARNNISPQPQRLNENRHASLHSSSSAWSCSTLSTCEAASMLSGSGSKTTSRPLWALFAPCCFHRYMADPVGIFSASFTVPEEGNNSFLVCFLSLHLHLRFVSWAANATALSRAPLAKLTVYDCGAGCLVTRS